MRKLQHQQGSHQQHLPLPVVARRLGVPFRTVLRLVRTHQLRARLVAGRRWFIDVDEVTRFRRIYGRAA